MSLHSLPADSQLHGNLLVCCPINIGISAAQIWILRAASLRGGKGEIKSKNLARNQLFVVVSGDVAEIVERYVVVVFVLVEEIVVEFYVIVIIIEDQIVVIIRHLHLLGLSVFSVRNHGAVLAEVERDDLAGVRAYDRIGVEVIETLAGGWADTLCSPFFLGHDSPFKSLEHLQ